MGDGSNSVLVLRFQLKPTEIRVRHGRIPIRKFVTTLVLVLVVDNFCTISTRKCYNANIMASNETIQDKIVAQKKLQPPRNDNPCYV